MKTKYIFGLPLLDFHHEKDTYLIENLARTLLYDDTIPIESIGDIWYHHNSKEEIKCFINDRNASTTNGDTIVFEEDFETYEEDMEIHQKNHISRLDSWISKVGPLTEEELRNYASYYEIPFNKCMHLMHKSQLKKVSSPKKLWKQLNDVIIGQEKSKKVMATALYTHLSNISHPDVHFPKHNILLLGPSGTGKTLLVSTSAKLIDVPMIKIDAASLVKSGIIGSTFTDYFTSAYHSLDNSARLQNAIVFVDEFDKLAFPYAYDRRAIQTELLSIIGEDGKVAIEFEKNKPKKYISTTNMLFIFAGAFSNITYDNKHTTIGYMKEKMDNDNLYPTSNSLQLRSSIIKYGFVEEVINRFQQIVLLDTLSKEDIIDILKSSGASELELYQSYAKAHGKELIFTEEFKTGLAEIAYQSKMNGRSIKNLLAELLNDTMMDCVTEERQEIIIDTNYLS